MRILPATPENLVEAVQILQRGGVIIHATETCYGLACDLTNYESVAHLFVVKERPPTLPVSALFASVEAAKNYVEWPPEAEELARKHLPGPLTLVLRQRKDAPRELFTIPSGGETVGVRISSHPFAQAIVEQFGSPLSTTSANLHNQPNPYDLQEVLRQFSSAPHQPDLILDSGPLPFAPPSTVIDLSQSGQQRIRRQGGLL